MCQVTVSCCLPSHEEHLRSAPDVRTSSGYLVVNNRVKSCEWDLCGGLSSKNSHAARVVFVWTPGEKKIKHGILAHIYGPEWSTIFGDQWQSGFNTAGKVHQMI